MSWFRKYRPTRVKDLDLVSVKEDLSQMMVVGKIPQVLLFAGPKGTGKTSSARIIAGILNDPQNYAVVDHLYFGQKKPKSAVFSEPDSTQDIVKRINLGSSFVVQEMDAASNRGIDDIRALKEKLALPPAEGKITVYILDEVHMLTTEAFNALLKILEEPPQHVVFILATTEPHKIPDTVLSRCTLVNFSKALPQEISNALKKIVEREKLICSDEVLLTIANSADGSFRDAVKLLEALAVSDKKLELDWVIEKLRVVDSNSVQNLLKAVIAKDEKKVIDIFENLRSQDWDEKDFYKKLLSFLYQQLKIHLGTQKGQTFSDQRVVLFLLKELSLVQPNFHLPVRFLSLELIFLDLVFRAQNKNLSKAIKKNPSLRKSINTRTENNHSKPPKLSSLPSLGEKVVSNELSEVSKGDAHKLLSSWQNFVSKVSQKQSSVAMLLQSAKPLKALNDEATIGVYYLFHKERLEDASTLQILQQCVEPLVGGRLKFNFALASDQSDFQAAGSSEKDQLPELAKEALL